MPVTAAKDLHGTLDALVLKTLTWGPRHGYAIARWLEDTSSDVLRVEEGSLYPALYRMEHRGWITSDRRRPASPPEGNHRLAQLRARSRPRARGGRMTGPGGDRTGQPVPDPIFDP